MWHVWGRESFAEGFGGKPEGRVHWADQVIDGSIILKKYSGSGKGFWGWMDLTQDRGRSWALVSTVMDFRVP